VTDAECRRGKSANYGAGPPGGEHHRAHRDAADALLSAGGEETLFAGIRLRSTGGSHVSGIDNQEIRPECARKRFDLSARNRCDQRRRGSRSIRLAGRAQPGADAFWRAFQHSLPPNPGKRRESENVMRCGSGKTIVRTANQLDRVVSSDPHSGERAIERIGTEVVTVEHDHDLCRMPVRHDVARDH
jgi:hypothetical protein